MSQSAFTDVREVVETRTLISVDLTNDPWNPYPNISCACPRGDLVIQQLVWTVQTALGSTSPVQLTVNGTPARGILGQRIDGPIPASEAALPEGTWPITADGRTYGTADATDGNLLPVRDLPDLVAVVGNHGRHGYADSDILTGPGPAPSNPHEALEEQEDSRGQDVPVYGIDGQMIDTFTLAAGKP